MVIKWKHGATLSESLRRAFSKCRDKHVYFAAGTYNYIECAFKECRTSL